MARAPKRAPTVTPRVFLTFADNDRTIARSLALELAKRGWPCWSRATQMARPQAGSDAMIRACPILIVLCTPAVPDSAIVAFDVRKAHQLDKPIIALAVAPDGLPVAADLGVPHQLLDASSAGLSDATIDQLTERLGGLSRPRARGLHRLSEAVQNALKPHRPDQTPTQTTTASEPLAWRRPSMLPSAKFMVAAVVVVASVSALAVLRPDLEPAQPLKPAPVRPDDTAPAVQLTPEQQAFKAIAQSLDVKLQNIQEPYADNGRKLQTIDFLIANRSNAIQTIPPLMLRLFDSQGREVLEHRLVVTMSTIGPAEVLTLADDAPEFPTAAAKLVIAFEDKDVSELKVEATATAPPAPAAAAANPPPG